jgi:hypothetical protein
MDTQEIKEALDSAADEVAANGGWVIVTFQDGRMHSLEPNIRYSDDRFFEATDSHGTTVRFLLEHVEGVTVGDEPDEGAPL